MSTLIADINMQLALSQIKVATEIRDTSGNVMGIYTPKELDDSHLVESVKKLVDFKELERRKREEAGKGITTDELLRKLHSLEANG